MNFTKILTWFLILLLSFSNLWLVNANNTFNFDRLTVSQLERPISRESFFNYLWQRLVVDIPSSYKYINLKYSDISRNTALYDSMQRLVYFDLIKNWNFNINPKQNITKHQFYVIVSNLLWFELVDNISSYRWKWFATLGDIKNIEKLILDLENTKTVDEEVYEELVSWLDRIDRQRLEILIDAYRTLLREHYDNNEFSRDEMIQSAIIWMVESINDPYSAFFPPIEAREFDDSFSGEFEWIGAYVEMETPWVFRVVSPLNDSPALEAWIRWWDIILEVDWFEITREVSLQEAVSKVRWPAWSSVKLKIKRWEEILELEVKRAKVVINDVEYLEKDDFSIIQIKMFWNNVFSQFRQAILELKESNNNKVIFDLRNNPGWYLDSVVKMLSLFIDAWEPIAIVNYKNFEQVYNSFGEGLIDLWDYDIFILQNSWSASASEIMIWAINDYFPDSISVWEKTFWKWSVQTLREYIDWSTLKYTIARWYTWKTNTPVDTVWIEPKVLVEFDEDKEDNQLQYILDNY